MNRRHFTVALTGAMSTLAIPSARQSFAQTEADLPFTNASFILDPVTGSPEATAMASPDVTLQPVELTGYILGDLDAPNTLTVFSDYRCPHCRMFYADIEPRLIEDFVRSGQMNLEFLDMTVIGVPSFDDLADDSIESVQAAEAAACAAEQNAYLPYRDWLYSGELRTTDGDFSDDNLIAAADELELDVDRFAESLTSGRYEAAIINSVLLAISIGVQGTPTMTLNHSEPFFVPEKGYDGLKELLEENLITVD